MNNSYLLTVLLTATLGAMAANDKVAPDLKQVPAHQAVKVIVRWQHGPSDSADSKVRARGGKKISDLRLIDSAVYEMDAASAAEVERNCSLTRLAPSRPILSKVSTGASSTSRLVFASASTDPAGINQPHSTIMFPWPGLADQNDTCS